MITDNAVKDRTTFLAHTFEEKTEKHTQTLANFIQRAGLPTKALLALWVSVA